MRSNLADDTFRAEVTAADLNGANMFVGEAVGLIHDVLPAATILRRMVLEADNSNAARGIRETGVGSPVTPRPRHGLMSIGICCGAT